MPLHHTARELEVAEPVGVSFARPFLRGRLGSPGTRVRLVSRVLLRGALKKENCRLRTGSPIQALPLSMGIPDVQQKQINALDKLLETWMSHIREWHLPRARHLHSN